MGTTYVAEPDPELAAGKLYAALPSAWYQEIPPPEDSFFHNGSIIVNATVFHDWNNIPGITAKQAADCAALSAWFNQAYDEIEWPIWANAGESLADWETKTIRELILTIRPQCDPWVLGNIDSFTRGVFNGNMDEISALQGIDMLGDEYEGAGG